MIEGKHVSRSTLKSSPMEKKPSGNARKSYVTPEVVMLGNLAALTKALGGINGKNDGGSGKDKTGF